MLRILLWIVIFPGKRKDFILAERQGSSIFHSQAGLFKESSEKEGTVILPEHAPYGSQ